MARDYSVLVTGFGVNLNAPSNYDPSNPSGLIAGTMPASLPATHALNASGADINFVDSRAGGFHILPGERGAGRKQLQTLHDEYGAKIDLWIHLGRGPWDFVTCERLAFRQDFTSSWVNEAAQKGYYLGPDNLGQNVDDLGPCPWTNVPTGLNTELDVESIVPDATRQLSKYSQSPLDIVSHLEAGPAGCGYCFYESMANCFVAGRKRNVLFMHLPRHTDESSLLRAKDAVLAVIGASVAGLMRQETMPTEDYRVRFGRFR